VGRLAKFWELWGRMYVFDAYFKFEERVVKVFLELMGANKEDVDGDGADRMDDNED